jgi:NAD(P)-dependent dehydrogenase (short-subunit alcohol dehydrogenase family)
MQEISNKRSVRCTGSPIDVVKPGDIERFAGEILREFGKVDILINNAGAGSDEKIMDAPDEKWEYYFNLHLMAAVRLSHALVPSMRENGGGIILNNASVCERQPPDCRPMYNVTKAALSMFSKCLANELLGDNIIVNCINLGYVLIPDWIKTATSLGKKEGISWEEYIGRIARENAPVGRFAKPEEAATFFVFLCSPWRVTVSAPPIMWTEGS